MAELISDVQHFLSERIAAARSLDELEAIRVAAFGRKAGLMTLLARRIARG